MQSSLFLFISFSFSFSSPYRCILIKAMPTYQVYNSYNQVHSDKMNHFAFISVNCGTQCLFSTNPKMISISTNAIHSSFFHSHWFSRSKKKDSRLFAFGAFYFRNSALFRSVFRCRFPFTHFLLFFTPLFEVKKILCAHSPSSQLSYIPINQVFIWFGQTFHSFSYGSVQLVFL